MHCNLLHSCCKSTDVHTAKQHQPCPNVVWCHIKPTFTPLSYLLKTYNAPNCANSRASASHRCDFAPPPFGENMLQRGIKEIKLFPFFFLLTPGSSLKQRRVMRVHLLSSMHCTKLSWHDRKFACNPRPWRQISVGMAEQRQCMKACIRLMLFYSANHGWSSLPALSLFQFLSESWQITVTTSPFNPTVHNRCESIVHFLVQVEVMNKKIRQMFSWCRCSTSGLVFGFQQNKTRGCHLWAQLINFKHFDSSEK